MHRSFSYAEPCRELTQIRAQDADMRAIPVEIAREPLRRVHRAFQGFRSADRYDSFSASPPVFRLEGTILLLSKLGGFRFQSHRKLCGTPTHVTIAPGGRKWVARVVSDLGPAPEKRAVGTWVGVDVGLHAFATTLCDFNPLTR